MKKSTFLFFSIIPSILLNISYIFHKNNNKQLTSITILLFGAYIFPLLWLQNQIGLYQLYRSEK